QEAQDRIHTGDHRQACPPKRGKPKAAKDRNGHGSKGFESDGKAALSQRRRHLNGLTFAEPTDVPDKRLATKMERRLRRRIFLAQQLRQLFGVEPLAPFAAAAPESVDV